MLDPAKTPFWNVGGIYPERDHSGAGRLPDGCSHTEPVERLTQGRARHNLNSRTRNLPPPPTLPKTLGSAFAAEQTNNEAL